MAGGFEIAQAYVSVAAQPDDASVNAATNKMGARLTKWAAGIGLGALITKGLVDNLNIGTGVAKLTAQMGLTRDVAGTAGKAAGEIYRDNFGGSMTDVNNAIKAVGQNMVSLSGISRPELKKIAEGALGIASTFDVDVNDATRAAGKLMSTGLAKDSTQAFDIITKGFQSGLDSSGDFLDTLNEYSTQFSKIGIDGPTALNALNQFVKAGARDTDAAADAFKEFGLRAIDTASTTTDAYKSLNLNADEMRKTIAGGGPAATTAMQQVITAIKGVKDPVEQNRVGVELFGTQWEDTVRAILPNLDLTKNSIGGIDGATSAMNATVGATPEAKIEGLKRQFEGVLQSSTQLPGPMGTIGTAFAAMGSQGIVAAAGLSTIATNFSGVGKEAIKGAISVASSAASMVASAVTSTASVVAQVARQVVAWAVLGVESLINAAKVAAAWLISMGPIALVIAAVVGLVALIIANWDTIKNVIGSAWEWIKGATAAAWGWITGAFGTALGFLIGAVSGAFNAIRNAISGAISGVVGFLSGAWNAIIGIVRGAAEGAANAAIGAFNRLAGGVGGAIGGAINVVRGIPGQIMGAIGNLGSLLFDSGRSIIQGLVNGIKSMAGAAKDAVGSVLGAARNLLPHSPAKEGPFSGRGWTTYSGASIVDGLTEGIEGRMPQLASAARALMTGIQVPITGVTQPVGATALAGGSSGGGAQISIANLTLDIRGTFDLNSPTEQRTLIKNIRDGLVALESETK